MYIIQMVQLNASQRVQTRVLVLLVWMTWIMVINKALKLQMSVLTMSINWMHRQLNNRIHSSNPNFTHPIIHLSSIFRLNVIDFTVCFFIQTSYYQEIPAKC